MLVINSYFEKGNIKGSIFDMCVCVCVCVCV